jgi:hypothetical protein
MANSRGWPVGAAAPLLVVVVGAPGHPVVVTPLLTAMQVAPGASVGLAPAGCAPVDPVVAAVPDPVVGLEVTCELFWLVVAVVPPSLPPAKNVRAGPAVVKWPVGPHTSVHAHTMAAPTSL